MRKKDFLIEVQKELDHIKVHATDEEKGELDFSTFDHNSVNNCIYGQMTGDCSSSRANQLYHKTYDSISNGESVLRTNFKNQDLNIGNAFTALEKYLYMIATNCNNRSKKQNEVIEYIKGNLEKIVL